MKTNLQGIPKCGELQGHKRLICLQTFCHENDSQGESCITFIAKTMKNNKYRPTDVNFYLKYNFQLC